LWFVFFALVVFLADRITKFFAYKYLYGKAVMVIPGFFRLVYAENKGAAFSLFASFSGFSRVFFLILIPVVVVAIIIYFLLRRNLAFSEKLALSLILGGAVGNLYDRIVYGKVIDFVDFHLGNYHWPAFNVADVAVFVGTLILLSGYFLKNSKKDSVIQ